MKTTPHCRHFIRTGLWVLTYSTSEQSNLSPCTRCASSTNCDVVFRWMDTSYSFTNVQSNDSPASLVPLAINIVDDKVNSNVILPPSVELTYKIFSF